MQVGYREVGWGLYHPKPLLDSRLPPQLTDVFATTDLAWSIRNLMAPLRKPPSPNAGPLRSILKKSPQLQAFRPRDKQAESLFTSSKKDKRKIRHEQLLARISKPATKFRRRRPSKKLVTTLESLAAALPDESTIETAGPQISDQVNVIPRKSMKSRPGAMKRRERLDKTERDRFAKNLAQMAAPQSASNGEHLSHEEAIGKRWSALRGFISQTLEKRTDISMKVAQQGP